jgi:hypothetical protein
MAQINDKQIKLDSVLAFEIEAFRAESQLAAQRFKAESALRAIQNSRIWRYTAPLRFVIDLIMSPLRKTKGGLKVLIFLSKVLR